MHEEEFSISLDKQGAAPVEAVSVVKQYGDRLSVSPGMDAITGKSPPQESELLCRPVVLQCPAGR